MPYLRHTEVDEIAAASREVAGRVVSVKASLSNINLVTSVAMHFLDTAVSETV